jgi:hypothetical protein
MEIWSLEVRLGDRWESRKVTYTREAMIAQMNLYVSRLVQTDYEVRIVPYVADESRAERLG